MSDHVLHDILYEVKHSMFFAIQADEATDVACNEQMCVCWVNKEYEIFGELIGLIQLTKTDSATIFSALKDVLIRCILPVSMCRGKLMTEQKICPVEYVEWPLALKKNNQQLCMYTA